VSAASEAAPRPSGAPPAQAAESLPSIVAAHAAERPDAVALVHKRHGIWQPMTYRALHERVLSATGALRAFGLRRGEPVALIGDPRPAWIVADLAVQAAGGLSIALHPTQSEDDLRGIFASSPVRLAFCGDDEQLALVDAALPNLERRVILDLSFVNRSHDDASEPFLQFLEHGGDSAPAPTTANPDALAIGAVSSSARALCFSHRAAVAAARSAAEWLGLRKGDRNLCVVSPAQVTTRLLDYYAPLVAGTTIALPESPSTIVENLLEVVPDYLVLTPRALELIASDVELRAAHSGRFKRAANAWAEKRRQRSSSPSRGPSRVLVDRPIVAKLGLNRARRVVSVAGQPSPELVRFYWELGVPLVVSYGQTESFGLVSCQRDTGDAGTVGSPIPGVEVQLRNGTLHVKSGTLAQSYLDGAPVQVAGGWLDTGDHGALDETGRVVVHAGTQDILRRSGQQDVLLTEVEARLRLSPYVSEVVVTESAGGVGALVQIELSAVVDWALRSGVPGATFPALAASREVRDMIGQEIAHANASLPEHEQVRDFRLLPRPLSVAEGEMTPTLRVRRAVVLRNFEDLAKSMRAEPAMQTTRG
jgi:long-chain acyl-CoA synthetase